MRLQALAWPEEADCDQGKLSRIVYHDFRRFSGLIVPKCSQLLADVRTLNCGRGLRKQALNIVPVPAFFPIAPCLEGCLWRALPPLHIRYMLS